MTSEEIDLSIIIPAYMEAGIIADTLESLAAFLKTRQYGQVEVLVVIADSPDGTLKIAESKASLFERFRVIKAGPRAGKGRDVRLGIFEAKGKYKLFMDADLATPLIHLDEVQTQVIEKNEKIGIAVRDLVSTHSGILRKAITRGGNLLAQIILLPGINDTQCGFKVFQAEAAEVIFSRMTIIGWGFDMEVLGIARMMGYDIIKIDAPDWSDPKEATAGLTGDSAFHAALQVLRDLMRVRLNVWFGHYKKANYIHKAMY